MKLNETQLKEIEENGYVILPDSFSKEEVNKIIIVLGYENKKIKKIALKSKKIIFVVNSQYLKGISTSIKCGLKKISKRNVGFLIAHGDMPLVSKTILNALCSALKNKSIFRYNQIYLCLLLFV